MRLGKILPGVRRNAPLKDYTTFKIGGPAKYFFVAKTRESLIKAITAAKKYNMPFFILGRGSNLLVADKGYKGLVIKIQNTKYKIQNTKIIAEAGTMLGELVNVAADVGLTGFEWAAGIPGTVGGAVKGNAGAFGKSIKDIIRGVEIFDAKNEKIKILKNKDCKLKYRDSIFKHKKNFIIISVVLQLQKGDRKEIKNKITEYLNYRKERQPLNFPSAGSIFRNFTPYRNEVSGARPGELKKFQKTGTIPAAWLIEKCGLKGKRVGNVKISEKHANFIVNLGQGKAEDVKRLINLIKKMVKSKFGIKLEEEIQYLGFKNFQRG